MTSIRRLESSLAHANIPRGQRESMRVVGMECKFDDGSCELSPKAGARNKDSLSEKILMVFRIQIKDKDRRNMWTVDGSLY